MAYIVIRKAALIVNAPSCRQTTICTDDIVVAHVVMAHIVMAYVVMPSTICKDDKVMAHTVMAYVVMASTIGTDGSRLKLDRAKFGRMSAQISWTEVTPATY